jgi:hypothetical protein
MRHPTWHFVLHISMAAGTAGALLLATSAVPAAGPAPTTATVAVQEPAGLYQAPALRGPAPDLDLLWIARTPRVDWTQAQASLLSGDPVTFSATVRNAGSRTAPSFDYVWLLDGETVEVGRHPALAPGMTTEIAWPSSWDESPHVLELRLDTASAIDETLERNNSLGVRTDALSLGVWVEQSFFEVAGIGAAASGWGGASFEDWLQRQVSLWNQMLADARHPLTPEGILDRVRLDRVVVVPDGALACQVERPVVDTEQDLVWGFPAALVGLGDVPCDLPPTYAQDQTLWNRDGTLLHELSHARYLADTYGLNVRAVELALAGEIDASADTLPVHLLPGLPALSPPVELVIGGEIVRCTDIDGGAFTSCARGQLGTLARDHASGTPIYGGGVLITDGAGNALAGTAALPARTDHFHLGPDFATDLMNYGEGYGEHSAWAWNQIAGQRPTCGNYNAPCNLGAYLSELPERTELVLRWADGRPAANAEVALYRPTPRFGWYGRRFGEQPDLLLQSDAEGRVRLDSQPFGPLGIQHAEDFSNAVLALRIEDGNRMAVTFVDAAAFNLARARDGRQSAKIELEIVDWATRATLAAPQQRALPANDVANER